jgi:hypothetical protein
MMMKTAAIARSDWTSGADVAQLKPGVASQPVRAKADADISRDPGREGKGFIQYAQAGTTWTNFLSQKLLLEPAAQAGASDLQNDYRPRSIALSACWWRWFC